MKLYIFIFLRLHNTFERRKKKGEQIEFYFQSMKHEWMTEFVKYKQKWIQNRLISLERRKSRKRVIKLYFIYFGLSNTQWSISDIFIYIEFRWPCHIFWLHKAIKLKIHHINPFDFRFNNILKFKSEIGKWLGESNVRLERAHRNSHTR